MENLARQSYWDQAYAATAFAAAPDGNPVVRLIKRYVPSGRGSVFEIGCFPGNFLPVFGSLGYRLNGIDRAPRTDTDLAAWLRQQGYETGALIKGDIQSYSPDERHDIVCSFGFIEHFSDSEGMIKIHDAWLKAGGRLIITAPNFRGAWQLAFHRNFDAENLSRHNIEAMDPLAWRSALEKLGYEIEYCGWFGKFNFWTEKQELSRLRRLALMLMMKTFWLLRQLPWPNSPLYSPFCGIVAKKR